MCVCVCVCVCVCETRNLLHVRSDPLPLLEGSGDFW